MEPIEDETQFAFPKPSREARKAGKKAAARAKGRTRKQACDLVWHQRRGRCERCGVQTSRDVHPADDRRAQFNDRVPRSQLGDPTDPKNIELTCRKCHFGGPSGGHAPTPERMTKENGGTL